MTNVERRFTTAMREADTDDPGLIQEDDGTVWLVDPDGTRTQLPGSGGGLPAGGSTGEVLTKASNADGDADWEAGGGSQPVPQTVAAIAAGMPCYSTETIVAATAGFDEANETYVFASGSVSGVWAVTDHTTQRLTPAIDFTGIGDLPAVPDWLATLAASWGADPSDVWDLTSSTLTVLALSGVDAGKSAIIGPSTATPHPITDYAAPLGSHPLPFDTKRAGTLDVTVSLVSSHWRVYMPSEGNYAAILEPYIDFFYP